MRRFSIVLVSVGLVALASLLASPKAPAGSDAIWLVTPSMARADLLGSRFPNIHTASCQPDQASASKVFKSERWWNRFLCSGRTRDNIPYRLTYRATGECGDCWTIRSLRGTTTAHLRLYSSLITPRGSRNPGSGGSVSGSSCRSGSYRNVDGDCIPGPSSDPGLLPGGPTAICRDGTNSYSQHRSGTCSHHGGMARWL